MIFQQTAVRPDFPLVAASTHSRAEIERAGKLKLNFVVLGAVRETLSHADQAPLGWQGFRALVNTAPLPVFAIGGMRESDRNDAIEHGAHGIAVQRGFSSLHMQAPLA